jgi:DNA ligase-1
MPEGADPEAFYQAIIHDPRGLPYSEGVVIKSADDPAIWYKVKNRDALDLKVVDYIEGTGKFAGTLGALVVETESGARSEVGSLQVTDAQRQWIWGHRDLLQGQVAEIQAMEVTKAGAVRAGVFVRFHPSKSDVGLLMYSESAAGSTDPEQSRPVMYAVKSAAGWRPGQ